MKALTWRSVSGGIAAVGGLLLLMVIVLKYARTGAVRGDKFRLYVAVPDANNVLEGTDVWLNGQRVGSVARIDFAPASAPLDERVVIATDVLTRVREHIRLDSRARLQSGGTIIGAPVVYITSGTPPHRVVAPGDTIHGVGRSDYEVAASRATDVFDSLPAIMADGRVIAANARAAGARIRAIMDRADRSSPGIQATRLLRRLTSASGSASRLARDTGLRNRAARVMAGTDSLHALLTSRATEVGRFRRDTSLARAVRALRDDVGALRLLAASPDGTVGRVTGDSALTRALDSLFAELTALMTDIRENPLRYARVF